jgi:DNA-binding CsgD family transcriptional regulator
MVKTDLGHVALAERDLPTARRLLEETVATLVAIGDRRAEGAVRDSLAAVALAEGHRDEARQHYLTILGIATELHDEPGFVNAVEGLATVAAEGGQWERALRLGAAAERLRDTLFFRRSMPFMRGTFEAAVARARRAMPEATATAVWNEGANMSREQLIAMALTGASRAPANIEPLSAREAEIAALVAEGRTNRQIADRLVIAERTVDAHVAHILDKLGFHSRSEIAAWAVRAGLGARSRPTAR